MSMNKKKTLLVLSLFVFSFLMLGITSVNAVPTTQPIEYVAEKPCDETSIRLVMRLFGYILLVARIAVPLIIIGFGTFDIFKSVVDKDEKSLTKQFKQLGIRILAGLIVFFIPNIVSVFFSMSDKLNIIETDQYKTCYNCILKPTKCSIESSAGLADKDGNCPSGYNKGVDGICYRDGICGSYTTKDTCPSNCKWSTRNGCQSK